MYYSYFGSPLGELLLSRDELDWLNAYHARVRDEVRPHLDESTRPWLDQATAGLKSE